MSLSVQQLLTPMSREEALDELLAQLDALGFSASSWHSGGKRRSFVELAAIIWADLSLAVRNIARAVFLYQAEGVGLTALCRSHYDMVRVAAIATQGEGILTADATAGPYTINVGDIVAADAEGRTFRNVTSGTLALGGTLPLTFEAEVAGEAGNIPINTLTVMQTALAGVTLNNPGSGVPAKWITRNGADEESDANLRLRAIARWALLSIERPADGYIGIALEVSGVTRVEIDASNPGGEGTVDVWAAGPNGTVGSGPGSTLEALQTALDAKRAVSAIVTARACTEQTQDVVGTVYVETARHDSDYEDACEEAVRDYIDALRIGGQPLPPGVGGFVDQESISGAIKALSGTVAVDLSTPSADVSVLAHHVVVVGTITLNFVDV